MVEERALQLAPPPGHSSLIVHSCFPTFLDISASYLSILPIYARTHPPTENPTSSLAPPPPTSKTHQQETWTSVWMWRAPPCTFPTLPAPAPAIYFTFSPRLLTVSHLDLVAGEDALDPLMQLQQNLAALNQVNQAIEANIVRPELPEEADRVEQLLVEFRAVQQRIHDLNQEMEARISVAIEAVAADLRHIFVLSSVGEDKDVSEICSNCFDGNTNSCLHLLVEVVDPLLHRAELNQQLFDPIRLLRKLWPHNVRLNGLVHLVEGGQVLLELHEGVESILAWWWRQLQCPDPIR